MAIQHERLLQIEFNFDNPDKTAVVADEIFCCLGTTIKVAGSKPAFYKVDHDYVLTIAQTSYSNGAKKFALISSMGANKNSSLFYNKTKGAIEEAVTGVGYESLYIFRPSLLLGQRADFRLGEIVGKSIMKIFSFAIPDKYKAIEARQVARAMIACMNEGKTGVHILESDSIAAI
jgi:uncharacterized protein YbjT (DUF2867 family)